MTRPGTAPFRLSLLFNKGQIDRLSAIIAYHGLNPEPLALKLALDCICHYDLAAIAEAEKAFLKAVNRDGNPQKKGNIIPMTGRAG
jgi:hypothetical protein